MKNTNQDKKTNMPDNGESEINWVVVGPLIAILLGTVLWAIFF